MFECNEHPPSGSEDSEDSKDSEDQEDQEDSGDSEDSEDSEDSNEDLLEDLRGVRVVRGPNWMWRSQDGGEGFVGTVAGLAKIDGWVNIIWDNGVDSRRYRAGFNGAYDLRVVDNAATGVRHGVQCAQGCPGEIAGFRWLCVACNASLCSACYFSDKHKCDARKQRQEFQLFETPGSAPVTVVKESSTRRVELKGIFPKARVKSRHDCIDHKNDTINSSGNDIGIGEVISIRSPDRPGLVQVKMSNGKTISCRLGADGKVDLQLEFHSSGGWYHPEHLPVLQLKHLKANAKGLIKFAEGDKVKVKVTAEVFESLQDNKYGGWIPEMKQVINKTGKVVCLLENGKLRVFYEDIDRGYLINPAALKRLTPFSIGQSVRVKDDTATWSSMDIKTKRIIGKTGRVLDFCNDAEVQVALDGKTKENVHRLPIKWLDILPVDEDLRNKCNKLREQTIQLVLDAASEGQINVLKELVHAHRLNVDIHGHKGMTALHQASHQGHLDVVTWLVDEQGANINRKDCDNWAAIHFAADGCHLTILEILVKRGAKLCDKDTQGLTPLQLATRSGCAECVRFLLQSDCCAINSQDSSGDTALHNAIILEAKSRTYRNSDLLDALLPSSDLNLRNGNGCNPLHLAAVLGNSRALEKILLTEQATKLVDAVEERNGFTALHLACLEGKKECVKLILKYCCKSDADLLESQQFTKYKWTPLLTAAYKGHYKIVEYLIGAQHEEGRNFRADVTARDSKGNTAVHLVAINIESLEQKPTKEESPHIFEIFEQLALKFPDADVRKFPALALICFLIREGCPWRNTSDEKIFKMMNRRAFREVFHAYSKQSTVEHVTESLIEVCILCSGKETPAGIIPDCGHPCEIICFLCVGALRFCPVCRKPINASERNNETDIGLLLNVPYTGIGYYNSDQRRERNSQGSADLSNIDDVFLKSMLSPSDLAISPNATPSSSCQTVLHQHPASMNCIAATPENASIPASSVNNEFGAGCAPVARNIDNNDSASGNDASASSYQPLNGQNALLEDAHANLNTAQDPNASPISQPAPPIPDVNGSHSEVNPSPSSQGNALRLEVITAKKRRQRPRTIRSTQSENTKKKRKEPEEEEEIVTKYVMHDGCKFGYQREATFQCTRTSNNATKAKCPATLEQNPDGTFTKRHDHKHVESNSEKKTTQPK